MQIRSILKPLFAVCLFLLLFTREGRSQILLTEDFESGFPPAGWVMINAGSGNAWSENTNPVNASSGTHSMKYTPASAKANAWAISPTIALSASKTYEISFSYKGSSNNYMADTVKLTIGNASTIAAQTNTLYTQAIFDLTFFTRQITYSPPSSGNYAIGFNCLSGPNQEEIYIDKIIIKENPPLKAIYVRQNATGTNNGSSWTNAFTTLTAAVNTGVAGDTIKVAKGTYKPTTDINNRDASFFVKNYMVVLGGYPDTGSPTDNDRNWGQHPAILSGKINVNTIFGSRHVMSFSQASEKTILDGFMIMDGYADDVYNPSGPDYQHYGAGLLVTNSSAKIRNCVFKNDRAQRDGAALAIDGGTPELENCFFVNNGSDPVLASTIYIYNNARPRIQNCVLAYNNCSPVIKIDSGNAIVTNSSFVGNYTSYNNVNRGSILCENSSLLTLRNTVFFGNRVDRSTDSTDIVALASTIDIANTITQAYRYNNPAMTGVNPKFLDTTSVAGPDGLYFTTDDGLQLVNPCSPAINTGQNSAAVSLTKDILGNARIANSIIDLGAYEVQAPISAIPKILYVNKQATGSNDGTSWANAFTDLQKALRYCSDTIRVASGSYSPSATDERASFWMENKRVISGGYPSIGNPSDGQRDPIKNPTILSGDLTNGKRSITILRGPFLDSSAKLDGFLITRANGRYHGYENDAVGAIFMTNYSSPEFSNCAFAENFGDYGSVLVTRNNSNPRFTNCIFERDTVVEENNPINSYGGIISNMRSNPSFIKCIFRKNSHFYSISVTISGGVFFNYYSNPVIDSCLFLNNRAYGAGAAIFNLFSDPVIKNSQFIGNMPGAYEGASYFQGTMGGDICNNASSPLIQNCSFIDSFFCDYGGSIANMNNSNPVFEHCEFRNTRAVYKGGAVYNENSNPVFTSCIFYNNPQLQYITSTMKGASFFNKNSKVKLYNCLVVGAYGYTGNFMENFKSTAEITNCVIGLNQYIANSYSSLSSIYSYDSSRTSINNTIFWKNKFGNQMYYDFLDSDNNNYLSSFTTVTNSMLETITSLSGVNSNLVGVDPKFNNEASPAGVDNTFFTADDGFILQSCSPAVNSGLNSAIGPLTTDILGNNRIKAGIVDRGAYEFTGAPSVLITVTDSTICQGTPVIFNASGSNLGNNPVYQWQLNGVNVANTSSFTSSSLSNNDVIRVILTSNAGCLTDASPVTSPSISMEVSLPVTPSVSISGTYAVPPGQQVIITADPVHGGPLPLYIWQDSTSSHSWQNISGAIYSSIIYTSQNGNKLRCIMTSNENCATPLIAQSNVLTFGTVTAIVSVPAARYGIKMFPNPGSDIVVIDNLNLADKWKTAEIISLDGKQIKTPISIKGKETVTIPVNNLPQNVYIIILRNEKGWIATMKFVKL